MGSEWVKVEIQDIAEVKSGKRLPKGNTLVDSTTPYPYIRLVDISGGKINSHNLKYLTSETREYIKKYIVNSNDVCLAIVGHTIGMVFYVDNEWDNVNLTENAARITNISNKVNSKYLYYFLISPQGQHDIRSRKVGSAQGKLPLYGIKSLTILLPPLPEQKAIAHVLGSLDDRIELNRRMNETLEGMAQTLFKSWFVDFDPVLDNALASGKEIPPELKEKAAARAALGDKRKPLPKEIRTLFPDAFSYSDELGWIPKGWKVKPMNMILKSISETYPLKSVDKVVFLNTGDILDGHFLHNDLSEVATLPGQAKKSIKKDDILYSEIRPKNRRFAYVSFDAPEHVVSTKLMVLRAISDIKSIFAYFILKQKSSIDYLQMMAESRSGTFPQITFDVLSTINTALPDKHAIINYFTENIIERSFEKSIANTSNSTNLSKLRDTLLPKLLSGEIRIPDAEKMVEELEA